MKVSTVLIFATSIMGAAAQYGDLEQRDFELDQREIDLERREIKFKRMAQAWLATRNSSPCGIPCPAGTYCNTATKQCESGNNRAPNKKAMAAKNGGSKKGGRK